MKTSEKIAITAVGVLAALGVGVALVAPTVLREFRRVAAPIQKMKGRQQELERVTAKSNWQRPASDVIAADQLERFLQVRRRIEESRRQMPEQFEHMRGRRTQSLEELKKIPDVLEGVTDVVGKQIDALVEARMSPEEYHWLERVVYRDWRGPLRRAGTYPLITRRAAAEIDDAAGGEQDRRVRERLRAIAEQLRRREPAPPEGFDPQTHALLLAHLDDIERWSMDDEVRTGPFR